MQKLVNDTRNQTPVLMVSDVSTGYGTPQVVAMARSLATRYGRATAILEPDQLERPRVLADDEQVRFERIVTMSHPYSWAGRNEFARRVRARIERLKPEVLVLSSYYALPALLNLRHRPALTILHQLEHVGEQAFELELVRAAMDRIDLIIFPEPNRARVDMARLRPPERIKVVLLYNCASTTGGSVLAASKRNGRLFYGGTFDKTRTNADYFLDDDLVKFPIDIYGQISGFEDQQDVTERLTGARGGATYRGYIASGSSYFERMSRYCFSIIMWNPLDEATQFAAPNKFFDAIAAGVPPIAAPHPMCVEIIRRFGCGILLDDWTLSGFRKSLHQALKMRGSEEYKQLVSNCVRARDSELNWEYQMKRLEPHLPSL